MYIGIDLGTTGCKAGLYDQTGVEIALYNAEYPLIAKGNYVEQDANSWWEMIKKSIRFVSKGYGDQVKALSVSTQGISFVPVDKQGKPLYNAISWLDERATEETKALEKEFGANIIYEKTGKPLIGAYTLPKMMWFKKHLPEIYAAADKLLLPLDFINLKLTGQAVTDYSMASGTMLYNLKKRSWDEELLAFSGISEDKLARVQCMGTTLGTILPSVAETLGISAQTEVVLGGQDQKLAALGSGITENICTVSLGTATAITKISNTYNDKTAIPCFVFSDTAWAYEASLATTGAALKWVSTLLGKTYRELDELAETSCNGANGVRFSSDLSRGGMLDHISLATSSGDIVRALYEDIGERISQYIEQMGGAEKIIVFGGGSKSDVWLKVIQEKTNRTVYRSSDAETASIGAAILASGYTIKKGVF